MNGPRTAKTGYATVCQALGWVAVIAMGASVLATVHAAKVDWNIPANPAAQRRLCADYPPEPSAEDISDYWDSLARRRIIACEKLLAAENPDPDLYYYAGRLWLDIAFADRARDMFRRGVDAGSTKAMLALGYWHWEQRDDPKAMFKLYTKAARMGDPVALATLGIIYRGIDSTWSTKENLDRQRGLELLRVAAQRGYPIADYALGMTTWPEDDTKEERLREALLHIRAAARAGVLAARETLEEKGYQVPELEDGMRYPTLWPRVLILNRP